MPRLTARFVALALIATIVFSCQSFAKDEQTKLNTLSSEIAKLQKKMQSTRTERDKSAAHLRAIELQTADTLRNVLSLDTDIRALDKDLGALLTQYKQLDEQHHRQARQVARTLAATYRLGQEEPLKVLLNMENPEEIGRTLKYYEHIVTARNKILEDYQNTMRDLHNIQQSLSTKQNTLAEQRSQLQAIQRRLGDEKQRRSVLLASSEKQVSSEKERLAKLNLERTQLETLIQTLKKHAQSLNISSQQPFSQQRGKLPWPIQAKVEHSFGSSRGSALKWQGWLLNASAASPVRAIHHGRVVFSDYLRGQGLLIIIDHGDNYLSLYAHNQALLKEVGDWVYPEEIIAKAGNTGGLERHALYFEIRNKGKAVDPKVWLKPRT